MGRATKAGDSETVLSLMADDVVFLIPGHAPFGKPAFSEAMRAQSSTSVEFEVESEVQEVKILGDWAYMLTKLTVTAIQPGKDPSLVRAGFTLSILRKQEGKWRLTRDANLLAPVAQPVVAP